MSFYKKIIVIVGLMSVFTNTRSGVDPVAVGKCVLQGALISAYPLYRLKESLESYANADAFAQEQDVNQESFEYKCAEKLIPGMRVHGKPVRVKYSTKTCHNGMVNGKNAFYLVLNKASVEKNQSLVDAYYSKSYSGAISMNLRHEIAHMTNNDVHPALDGVASLGAFCVGGVAHYMLKLGLRRMGVPYGNFVALPAAVGSTWATLHARDYWHEYKADEDAYQNGTYNEVVSDIVSHALHHRVKEMEGSGSIIELIRLRLTDPHPSDWARAQRGNVVLEKRFGDRVDMPLLYNNLVRSLKIDSSL